MFDKLIADFGHLPVWEIYYDNAYDSIDLYCNGPYTYREATELIKNRYLSEQSGVVIVLSVDALH